MINALMIGSVDSKTEQLNTILQQYCPNVQIKKRVNDLKIALQIVEESQPNLIILDITAPNFYMFNLLNQLAQQDLAFIILTESRELACEAIKFGPTGYVLKPVDPYDFARAIKMAQKKIQMKEERKLNKNLLHQIQKTKSGNELLGIPTMEGFDFIKIPEIIRCKGLQRCTKIVMSDNANIISSYNLGEFIKRLEPRGFFSPHRSHLINLCYIKKYKREGAILMEDDFNVPISRRRKNDFLNLIEHL